MTFHCRKVVRLLFHTKTCEISFSPHVINEQNDFLVVKNKILTQVA